MRSHRQFRRNSSSSVFHQGLSMSLRCFACSGPYHPATGHVFTPDVVYCGPCALHFFRWWKGHSNRRWGATNFYEAAVVKPTPEQG